MTGAPFGKLRSLLLFLTVAFDGVLMLGLAGRDAYFARTPSATLGSGLWLAAGVVSVIAAVSIAGKRRSWLGASAVSQLFVALLATYVFIVDLRSPARQWTGVGGFAFLVGAIAVIWLALLVPHIPKSLNKGWAAVAALFPLLGLFQLWLQTDYLPRSSVPLVDVSAHLVELGRSGSTLHLAANIEVHSRSSVQADVVGSLLRITSYPKSAVSTPATPDSIAKGLDLFGTGGVEFRTVPLQPGAQHLLYASAFAPIGSFLPPGVTVSYHPAVDVDTNTVSHVRLTVTLALITTRRLGSVSTCYDPKTPSSSPKFATAVAKPVPSTTHGHFICVQTEIGPRNVTQELVADDPKIRTYIVLDDPSQKDREFPVLLTQYGTSDSFDRPGNLDVGSKIDDANPSEVFDLTDEFVVGDP